MCEETSLTQPSLLTIIAVDTLISLLDVEISKFLPSPDSKAEPDSKKAEIKASSTDTMDTSKDAKKAADADAKVADPKPAVDRKPVPLTVEEKHNINTMSLLCSRLLPRFISYAHNFILSCPKDCGPETSGETTLYKAGLRCVTEHCWIQVICDWREHYTVCQLLARRGQGTTEGLVHFSVTEG